MTIFEWAVTLSLCPLREINNKEFAQYDRRRENMVGVNMVLAESVKLKHGLYKSCGRDWFEGIMLEPCLLQPCFHVAGMSVRNNDQDQGGERYTPNPPTNM